VSTTQAYTETVSGNLQESHKWGRHEICNFRSELHVVYGSEYWTCTGGNADLIPSRRDKGGQERDKELELEVGPT